MIFNSFTNRLILYYSCKLTLSKFLNMPSIKFSVSTFIIRCFESPPTVWEINNSYKWCFNKTLIHHILLMNYANQNMPYSVLILLMNQLQNFILTWSIPLNMLFSNDFIIPALTFKSPLPVWVNEHVHFIVVKFM